MEDNCSREPLCMYANGLVQVITSVVGSGGADIEGGKPQQRVRTISANCST